MGIEYDTFPKDLDFYLKKKFNYGLLDFTESICFVYEAYKTKNFKSFLNSSKKLIRDLEKAKNTISKNMDNFDAKPTSIAIDARIERRKSYVEAAHSKFSFLETGDKIDPSNLLMLV